MTRAYIQAQPNPPLANTGTGAAGTILGTERSKLQAMPAWVAADKTNLDANTAARHTHANLATLNSITAAFTTADKTNLDANTAARHTHANLAVLNATDQSFTTALLNKLNSLLFPIGTTTDDIGAEVGLGSAGYTTVILSAVPATSTRPMLVCGHITFRNGSGATAIGYFRVRHTGTGAVVASGQVEVNNGQRHTVGFNGLSTFQVNSGESFVLEARSSAASGMLATNVNGMSDVAATRLNILPQGA